MEKRRSQTWPSSCAWRNAPPVSSERIPTRPRTPCWKPWRLGFGENWKTFEENCQELVPMDLVDSNDMVAVLDELQQVIRKSILIRNGEFLEEAS